MEQSAEAIRQQSSVHVVLMRSSKDSFCYVDTANTHSETTEQPMDNSKAQSSGNVITSNEEFCT